MKNFLKNPHDLIEPIALDQHVPLPTGCVPLLFGGDSLYTDPVNDWYVHHGIEGFDDTVLRQHGYALIDFDRFNRITVDDLFKLKNIIKKEGKPVYTFTPVSTDKSTVTCSLDDSKRVQTIFVYKKEKKLTSQEITLIDHRCFMTLVADCIVSAGDTMYLLDDIDGIDVARMEIGYLSHEYQDFITHAEKESTDRLRRLDSTSLLYLVSLTGDDKQRLAHSITTTINQMQSSPFSDILNAVREIFVLEIYSQKPSLTMRKRAPKHTNYKTKSSQPTVLKTNPDREFLIDKIPQNINAVLMEEAIEITFELDDSSDGLGDELIAVAYEQLQWNYVRGQGTHGVLTKH